MPALNRLALLIALLVPVPGARAAVLTWPGPAPCNATLVDCVNAAAVGDTVQIAASTPIAESIVFNKSLTVVNAPGVKPALANGHFVFAALTGPGPLNVRISGLRLTNGYVQLIRNGTGNADFTVENMIMDSTVNSTNTRIRIDGNNTGTLGVVIRNNRIQAGSDTVDAPAIDIRSRGPAATAEVAFNHIQAPRASQANAIRVFTELGGSMDATVFANQANGSFGPGMLMMRTLDAPMTARVIGNAFVGTRSLAPGTILDGVNLQAGSSDLDVQVYNNTITDTSGGLLLGRHGAGTGNVAGTVRNNLVAFNQFGLFFEAGALTVSNQRNLVFGNAGNGFTPGTGTVTADPQLVTLHHPRLRAGSPAINAGDAPGLQIAIVLAGQPQVDADGLRRTIGTGTLAVDIGAYEFGDHSLLLRKTDGLANNTAVIDDALTNGQPGLRLQLTKSFSPAGFPSINNPGAIGVYYTAGARWAAFMQSLSAMPSGAAFNVFAPGPQGAFGTAYAHTASAANINGHFTQLSQTFLNGSNEAIVLVTPNWNQPGTAVYHNHNIAVGPACLGGPAPECWVILNQDGAAMVNGVTFNVYAHDPSPNAWVHTATASNSSGQSTRLDHPLLNGNRCARPQVTRKLGALFDSAFDVTWSVDSWYIFNQTGAQTPGSQFYVVVDPRQVFECNDLIFANGLQP